MKKCKQCDQDIPPTIVIDGVRRWLHKREFCLACSPIGTRRFCGPKAQSKRAYDRQQLEDAVKASCSIADALGRLGLFPGGANYRSFNSRITKYGIDISHFSGKGYLKGKTHNWAVKTPLEDLLVNGSTASNGRLKSRLLKAGLLENKCYSCGITKWLDKPAPLELEHKNGVNNDNRLENLELLCANCHAFTPTYRGRNIKKAPVTGTGLPPLLKIMGFVGSNPTRRTADLLLQLSIISWGKLVSPYAV
jgi:hypothetical protein